jgi:glutaminase
LDYLGATDAAVMERYPVQQMLDQLYARYSDLTDGNLANYIPELAAVDPAQFAISIAAANGFCYDAQQVGA